MTEVASSINNKVGLGKSGKCFTIQTPTGLNVKLLQNISKVFKLTFKNTFHWPLFWLKRHYCWHWNGLVFMRKSREMWCLYHNTTSLFGFAMVFRNFGSIFYHWAYWWRWVVKFNLEKPIQSICSTFAENCNIRCNGWGQGYIIADFWKTRMQRLVVGVATRGVEGWNAWERSSHAFFMLRINMSSKVF